MFFLQDTWAINDALRINFGFKSLEVKNQARKEIDIRCDPGPSGRSRPMRASCRRSVSTRCSTTSEVFGSYTENMRAFIGAVTGSSPFATTAVNFAALEASGGL